MTMHPPTHAALHRRAVEALGRAVAQTLPEQVLLQIDGDVLDRALADAAAAVYEPAIVQPSQPQEIPDDQLDALDDAIREGVDEVYEAARRELKAAYRIGFAAALGYAITVEDGRVMIGDRPSCASCRTPAEHARVAAWQATGTQHEGGPDDLADTGAPASLDDDHEAAIARLAEGLDSRGVTNPADALSPRDVVRAALAHIDHLDTALIDAARDCGVFLRDGLNVEQEIRIDALDSATRLGIRPESPAAGDEAAAARAVITVASAFEAYIRDGALRQTPANVEALLFEARARLASVDSVEARGLVVADLIAAWRGDAVPDAWEPLGVELVRMLSVLATADTESSGTAP